MNISTSEFEDMKQLKDDVGQLKLDNVEIKINLSNIKDSVENMGTTLEKNVERITEALLSLATHAEKTNYLIEDNKKITKRIDWIELNLERASEEREVMKEQFTNLKINHDNCVERRKQDREELQNSPFTKAGNKIKEYSVYVAVAILLFLVIKHYPELVDFLLKAFLGDATIPE